MRNQKKYIKIITLLFIMLLTRSLTYLNLYNICGDSNVTLKTFHIKTIKYVSYGILISIIYLYCCHENKIIKKNTYKNNKLLIILSTVRFALFSIIYLILSKFYTKYLNLNIYISTIIIFFIISRNVHIRKKNKLLSKELDLIYKKDNLTNIYNFNVFEKIIFSWNKPYTIFFINVKKLKDINDVYGHGVGNKILIQVANSLKKLNTYENVKKAYCRYNSDKFLYAIDTTESNYIKNVLDKLCLNKSICCNDEKIELIFELNVGYAINEDEDFETIINNSELAMYYGKENKLNNPVEYSQELKEKYSNIKDLEKDLDDAIENDEIAVVFQPKICATTENVKGFEALARWNHRDKGLIFPNIFIKLAEESGKIHKVDLCILKKACEFEKKLEGLNIYNTCSVNFSVKTLQEEDIVNIVNDIIIETGVKKEKIIIEILENIDLNHNKLVLDNITELRKLGFKISIDDFGTEYSSLNRIAQVPFNELKIPKDFIDIIYSDRQLKVLESVIFMAKLLKTDTVIEGVETEYQYKLFKDLGFNLIQGYYFSKPLKEDEYIQWIRNYMRR